MGVILGKWIAEVGIYGTIFPKNLARFLLIYISEENNQHKLGKGLTKMAVALKDMERKAREKHLTLVDAKAREERMKYEFPYDDMYHLYNYMMEEMKKTK
jgi:hypothetical protein